MATSLLIVDDEEDIREMLSRHFRYLEYQVECADNGKTALDVLGKKKIDVLISDIMMPELNGVELLRQVRQDYPMVRPVMITGYVTLENAMACIRYGADRCVFKPLRDLKELENAVKDCERQIQYWIDVLKELQGMR